MNNRRLVGCAATRHACAFALFAMTIALSHSTFAQTPPDETEKLVIYAQCIRANGYAEFPDPAPSGRLQLKLDAQTRGKFEAAQRACKDKLPSGMAAINQDATPERLQALLGFSRCMRANGVNGFPDPTPKGVFEITSSTLDMGTPQAQRAAEDCRASNPIGGLIIRRVQVQ